MHVRTFCIILTEEGGLRLAYLLKTHGFLVDRKAEKVYAIVSDAYETDKPKARARCYLVHERLSQTIRLTDAGERALAPAQPARMPLTRPSEEGGEQDLSADMLYDHTSGRLVKRLENKRPTIPHAILLVGGGAGLTLLTLGGVVGAVKLLVGSCGPHPPQPASAIVWGRPSKGSFSARRMRGHEYGGGEPGPIFSTADRAEADA